MVSKRNKKIFHVTIIRPDGTETDVTRYIPYPVEWRDTLDETYDEATFEKQKGTIRYAHHSSLFLAGAEGLDSRANCALGLPRL